MKSIQFRLYISRLCELLKLVKSTYKKNIEAINIQWIGKIPIFEKKKIVNLLQDLLSLSAKYIKNSQMFTVSW